MALALQIGQCCLQGIRDHNEDAVAVHELAEYTLCLVADGMGGQEAGEWASKKAIEVVARELQCQMLLTLDAEQARQALRRAIHQADQEIIARQRLLSSGRRCATTLVGAVWQKGREVILTNIGDSPAFLIRGSRVDRLTRDHDVRHALIDNGTITAEQARNSPIRNVLYKYLGAPDQEQNSPDDRILDLQVGDHLLLCTDGLSNHLLPEELPPLLTRTASVQECADQLTQLALDRVSRDNVSCVLIRVVPAEADNSSPVRAMPEICSTNIRLLALALAAGENCAFALRDALLEEGHPALGEHFRQAAHSADCRAINHILGR